MSDIPVYDLKSGRHHPFHVPHASVWPFLGACAAGTMFGGTVMFMHNVTLGDFHVGAKGLLLGLFGVLAIMWVWWRDVHREAFVEEAFSKGTTNGLHYGMTLFI